MVHSYPGSSEGTGKVMWKGQSPVWKAGVLGKVAMAGTPSKTRLRCLRIAAPPSRHVEEELLHRLNPITHQGSAACRTEGSSPKGKCLTLITCLVAGITIITWAANMHVCFYDSMNNQM